jgi:hypothetical protein
MANRALLFLCFVMLGCVMQSPAAAPVMLGGWTWDGKSSADPEKLIKGKLRKRGESMPVMQRGGERNTPYDLAQLAYWETVRERKEEKPAKALRRLGIAYPLVKVERLDIADEAGGLRITYDLNLPRSIRPNPNGKVFSAKGDELVQDTFGYNLSYWENDTLVIETDAPEGGKVIEKFTVRENPHQLEYVVRVQMRMLLEPLEVVRLFNPAP